MKRKTIRDWDQFVESSSEFLVENLHKVKIVKLVILQSRVTLKYRNKAPSTGNLYVTNDNRSFRYKFTEKSDLDKLDGYIKSLLHVLANKPLESNKMEVEGKLQSFFKY